MNTQDSIADTSFIRQLKNNTPYWRPASGFHAESQYSCAEPSTTDWYYLQTVSLLAHLCNSRILHLKTAKWFFLTFCIKNRVHCSWGKLVGTETAINVTIYCATQSTNFKTFLLLFLPKLVLVLESQHNMEWCHLTQQLKMAVRVFIQARHHSVLGTERTSGRQKPAPRSCTGQRITPYKWHEYVYIPPNVLLIPLSYNLCSWADSKASIISQLTCFTKPISKSSSPECPFTTSKIDQCQLTHKYLVFVLHRDKSQSNMSHVTFIHTVINQF